MEITMWMAYVFLAIAVGTEIVATSTLPATMCFTKLKPSLVCIICYVICFYSLGMSLTHIPMGIACLLYTSQTVRPLALQEVTASFGGRAVTSFYWPEETGQ